MPRRSLARGAPSGARGDRAGPFPELRHARMRPREFGPLYIAMLEAGEAGGMLDEVLERLASMLEKDLAMRKKVGAALAYPIVVMCAAIGLVFLLLATIVPTLGRFFLQLNVEEPPSARALLFVGEIVRNPVFWGLSGAAIVGVVLLFTVARRDLAVAAMLDAARLRIPLFGSLHRKAVTARLGRMLGSLLHSGVDVLRAIVCARRSPETPYTYAPCAICTRACATALRSPINSTTRACSIPCCCKWCAWAKKPEPLDAYHAAQNRRVLRKRR